MYDYVKQYRWSQLKVGIVITIALVIVFLAVMFAGNIEKLFAPRVMIYAVVEDVKGLREGSPVWFSGVEVGMVQSIRFNEEHGVTIGMSILSDSVDYLKKDSKANILTLGLLGDKYVEITPGTRTAEQVKAGDILEGKTHAEIKDFVETSQASIEKIGEFVGMLEEILVKVEKGEGTLSKFIQDPAVYNNLKEATAELTVLAGKIESGKGTAGRLLNEDDLYVNLLSSAEDISLFARSLRESDGTVNSLINDRELYDRFLRASESLDMFTQRLSSSKGTVNRMIEDESLYVNINSASAKLDSILERIDKGEGLMGSMIKDKELAGELKSTLQELNALIKDIKENPGKYFSFSIF